MMFMGTFRQWAWETDSDHSIHPVFGLSELARGEREAITTTDSMGIVAGEFTRVDASSRRSLERVAQAPNLCPKNAVNKKLRVAKESLEDFGAPATVARGASPREVNSH
jgi:hypothetical protein